MAGEEFCIAFLCIESGNSTKHKNGGVTGEDVRYQEARESAPDSRRGVSSSTKGMGADDEEIVGVGSRIETVTAGGDKT